MASYQKYLITGASTLLLPLAKRLFQALLTKFTEESGDERAFDKDEGYSPSSGPANGRSE